MNIELKEVKIMILSSNLGNSIQMKSSHIWIAWIKPNPMYEMIKILEA
jgi:hypothetical protein